MTTEIKRYAFYNIETLRNLGYELHENLTEKEQKNIYFEHIKYLAYSLLSFRTKIGNAFSPVPTHLLLAITTDNKEYQIVALIDKAQNN